MTTNQLQRVFNTTKINPRVHKLTKIYSFNSMHHTPDQRDFTGHLTPDQYNRLVKRGDHALLCSTANEEKNKLDKDCSLHAHISVMFQYIHT